MPQSLAAVYIHIVFSTRDREVWFKDESQRHSLHQQLGGICNTLECPILRVGGTEDHVHLLCRFSRNITLSGLIKELKRVSSLWVNKTVNVASGSAAYRKFRWQEGYGAFSVSQSNVKRVVTYIENQMAHHRTMTFQDEMLELMRRHRLVLDEQHFWN